MEQKALEYFCSAHSKLASICIRIYEDESLKKLLCFFGSTFTEDSINNIPLNMTPNILQTGKSIAIYDEMQFVIGYIKSKSTGNIILLGPVRMGEITEIDISKILKKYGLPKLLETSISHFLLSTPILPIENFLILLSLFNLTVNDEIVTIQQIMQSDSAALTRQIEHNYIETADVEMPRAKGDYEATIVYFIKNGMLKEIESLQFENFSGKVGTLGPNQLRSLKNSLIVLNSICLRAAISGGLDTETAYTLGERYVQRIEKATSIPELGNISPQIRKDYCMRVKNLIAPKIDNLHILKVTEYIQNNIYKKITVTELAKIAGISPEYLSLLAKQFLHCTLPQYLNKAKITEAKKLLRFTNKTLSDIANLLNFSSQSHFQNQFKKIRGITPAEYREKYQVVIEK